MLPLSWPPNRSNMRTRTTLMSLGLTPSRYPGLPPSPAAVEEDDGMGDFDRDLLLPPPPPPRPPLLLLRLRLPFLLLPLPLAPLLDLPLLLVLPPCCFPRFRLRSQSETALPEDERDRARERPEDDDPIVAVPVASALGFPSVSPALSSPSAPPSPPPPLSLTASCSLSSFVLGCSFSACPPSAIPALSLSWSSAAVAAALPPFGETAAVAAAVGLAAPHTSHLRFLDGLCRVHAAQDQPGPGPRRLARRLAPSAAAAAAAAMGGDADAALSAADLGLLRPLPPLGAGTTAAAAAAADGSPSCLLVLAPAAPPPPSCSLLAYAASLDVRCRTWRRRPPFPLICLRCLLRSWCGSTIDRTPGRQCGLHLALIIIIPGGASPPRSPPFCHLTKKHQGVAFHDHDRIHQIRYGKDTVDRSHRYHATEAQNEL